MLSHTSVTFTAAPISCIWHIRQMLEVLCSSSGQRLHLELPDILELLSSSPSRVLPLCSNTSQTSVTYAPSELSFELLLRTISTWCQPNRHTKCILLVPVKSCTFNFFRLFRPDLFWVGHLVWAFWECHYIHSNRASYPLLQLINSC
jgi:hypothetical protein